MKRAGSLLAFAVPVMAARALAAPQEPSSPTGAEPAASSAPAASSTPAKVAARVALARATKGPVVPEAKVPDIRLDLVAPTDREAWTMRVRNEGDVPVRIAADARLLSLDVTPRGQRQPVHCELPADMRPADDLDRSLVVPPGRSYAEVFEPRLYCFGERALGALSPWSTVVAHLGFPSRNASRAQSQAQAAVSPIEGVEPAVAAVPLLTSAPIALPDEPSPTPALVMAAGEDRGAADRPTLRLSGPVAVDAETLGDVVVTLTLQNQDNRPVRVRFKPETIAFDVATPGRAAHCGWPAPVGAPLRDYFTTLGAGGSESLSVSLSDYCDRSVFAWPGLYVARPILDTRHAGGADIGLRTFEGQVIAATPTVVRLHRGTGNETLRRPRLEPAPAP